ncbi:MAG: hypothetical protein AB8G22_22565 [Saprospiraceae bacterium]
MKVYLFLFAFLMSCQFTFAQSSTKNRIRIKTDNTYLRVESDEDKLNVDYHFDKEKTWDLINSLNQELDIPASMDINATTYTGKTKGCKVHVSEGKLNIAMDKTKINSTTEEQLTEAILSSLLAVDVNMNISFDWD